ncbi:DUF1996 domain-containing protein [Kitasatospora sp. NRRL B-11411]|uniref:DUF1996 domain-containing protein n=1 Tax=Kitasatospora sp. NRRL B-11411 TaxID=1463822 RepID=UPI0004C3B430|nr:DUF1996 domain-containing protein [Kitasatospora sp. NRRL B-11411]
MKHRTSRGAPHRTALAGAVAAILAAGALTGGVLAQQAAAAADPLISQSKPVTASSVESASFPAAAVADNNLATRWASAWSDPQWVQIDLGGTASVSHVELDWEAAYASGYQLQTSNDATTWNTVYTQANGTGGTEQIDLAGSGRYVRLNLTKRGTQYGYSLEEFKVYGQVAASGGGSGYVLANPQVTGATPATGNPAHAYFHEFQANCTATHDLPDDPIVFPGKPGASHMHTFMGALNTNADSTLESLQASTTSCLAPGDKSGYWMPTMYDGSTAVDPVGLQTIYYKSGINDYTAVRPFPAGLRFVVASPTDSATDFTTHPGYVAGWECGNSYHTSDLPTECPGGGQLNIRFQAPSCWNGLYLDTPDHKSHMAYPIDGVCPADHPVALPMIEFKMAFPANLNDLAQLHLSSGRGFSFHYDFFNAWDAPTLAALVDHCIVGGLQCNARGYDETQPGRGAALNEQYLLP